MILLKQDVELKLVTKKNVEKKVKIKIKVKVKF